MSTKTASELVEAVAQVGMSVHREPQEIALDCLAAIVDHLCITEEMVEDQTDYLGHPRREALRTLLHASQGKP